MTYLTKKTIYQGRNSGSGGGGGGGNTYNGNRAITRNVIGLDGVNPGGTDYTDFLNNVFYPPLPPTDTLSVEGNATREIGASTAYRLDWAVFAGTNLVTGITLTGAGAIVPSGGDQSGNSNGNTANNTGTFSFALVATDGTLSSTANATIQYLARMFWGTTAKDGVNSPILDADILALTNSELATARQLSLTNFGGGNQYLIFAFPSSFGTPQFIINGLNNTAFSLVRSASNFVNSQGATIVMDVWVSNFQYNSPLDSVQLT